MGEKINKQLCILGIGDAGIKPAQILSEYGVKAIYLGIGNSRHVLEGINIINFESPKREFIQGAHKFMIPDMSVEAVLPPDVDALLKNDFHFVLFAGLGGYTGTKFIMAIAGKLIKERKTFTCFVSYPFRSEGKNRSQNADLFVSEIGNHKWVKMLQLDNLRNYGDMILSQAFTLAAFSLAQMADIELDLNLKIEFPQYLEPSLKVQLRTLRLEALSRKIKQANGSLDWINDD